MVRANKIVRTAQVTLLAMALVIPAGLFGCSSAVTGPSLESLTGDPIEIAAMESEIVDIMDMAAIPFTSTSPGRCRAIRTTPTWRVTSGTGWSRHGCV